MGMITWHDARAFCQWLSRTDGRSYRLPSEAEWKWAALDRVSSRFYFGDDESQLDQHAWYLPNAERSTHPVGMKQSNPWGLYDVYGNILELCSEWTRDRTDRRSIREFPAGPDRADFQIVFGGSYHDASAGGSGCISGKAPYSHVGFRVVTPVERAATGSQAQAKDDSSITQPD